MSSQQEFRRAAMVIASLDRRAADAILERFPAEQADVIRQTIMTLSDQDHDDQQRAVRDFLKSPADDEAAVLPEFSRLAGITDPETGPQMETANVNSSLDILNSLSDQTIATSVYHERIATISAIVAVLPAKRAARILRMMDHTKQPRILNVLAQGLSPNSTVVESAVRYILDQNAESKKPPTLGLQHHDALRVILHEMKEDEQQQMLHDLAASNPLLARRLGWRPVPSERPDPATA